MRLRSGSSLLFVVLILTAVSLSSLIAVRALISSSKQASAYDASERARQMARAGIDEATARLIDLADGVSAFGDYGAVGLTGNYPLNAIRMAFSPTCSGVLTATSVDVVPSCPYYYDISIRNSVAVAGTGGVLNNTAFSAQAFRAEDFPVGIPVLLPVPTGKVGNNPIIIKLSIGQSAQYQTCSGVKPGLNCDVLKNDLAGIITLPTSTTSLWFTSKTANTTLGANIATITQCTDVNYYCAIGKGYYTAEIVGHAGNALARYIIELHPNLAAGMTSAPVWSVNVPYIYQASSSFDTLGALNP
jgi:hypothetical protein